MSAGAGQAVDGVVHHSDAGTQCASIRYCDRLHDVGALASIGTVEGCDNAMAESVIGLHKAECVRHGGPVRTVDDFELRTLGWVYWFNQTRPHSALGDVPPVEFEQAHYRQITPAQHALPGELILH